MRLVARVITAVQYVGTEESATEVLTAIQTTVDSPSVWTLGSFNADSVTIHEVGEYGESDWSLGAGLWMVVSTSGPMDVLTDEAFSRQYRTIPEQVS